jgi:hypothetical protein
MFVSELKLSQSNLREIEKRTYMSYHQDGLLDIFIGMYILLLGFGIYMLTTNDFTTWFIFPAIFPAIITPLWISAKKKITMPRIGYVKFGTKGANKLTIIFIGFLVAGLGAFMAFSFASNQGWAISLRNLIIPNIMIILGTAIVLTSSLFAYIMGLNRLYFYGILSLMLFIAGYLIAVQMAYVIMIIGIVLLLTGSYLLNRFIRKYPLE